MRRRDRLGAAAVVASVLSLAVGACGSSQSSSSSSASGATSSVATATSSASTGGGATSSAAAPSGKPFVIGTIGSYAGDTNNALGPKIVDAWEKMVNASGGINGSPVTVKVIDDAADASKALQGVQTLVKQDHIMALAGELSNLDSVFQKYMERSGVPVVGGNPFDPPATSSPDWFPSGGNLPAATYGMSLQAKHDGNTKFGVPYCAEAPVCAQLVAPFNATVHLNGGTVVFKTKVAASQPSLTAPCLEGKSSGADAMFITLSAAVLNRMVTECARQGFKPAEYNIGAAAGALTQANPDAVGMTFTHYNVPLSATNVPGVAQFLAALNKYEPGITASPNFTPNDMLIWAGLQLFQAAATAGKLTPASTPADVKDGLYKLKNETLDGIAPPLNYVRGKPTNIACYFGEKLVGVHKMQPEYDGKSQCVPQAQVALLAKVWGIPTS
jgi:branched-chain amino acid transport system substrate-binding protein